MAEPQTILCPYCGKAQPASTEQCGACDGFFDPLSRRVTQQQMGPWFIRDGRAPFRPGCSYVILTRLIKRGRITADTILRGPTSRQFWTRARSLPGVAHLLGYCHACHAPAAAGDQRCGRCGTAFPTPSDRNQLGLDPDDPNVEREAAQAPQQMQGGAARATILETTPTRPVQPTPPTPQPMNADADRSARQAMQDIPTIPQPQPGSAGEPRRSSRMIWLLVGMNILLALLIVMAFMFRDESTSSDGPGASPSPPAAASPAEPEPLTPPAPID